MLPSDLHYLQGRQRPSSSNIAAVILPLAPKVTEREREREINQTVSTLKSYHVDRTISQEYGTILSQRGSFGPSKRVRE